MSVLRWLKKENVTHLPDPDKEQSMEMKSVVAAANDRWSVVSKKGQKTVADDHAHLTYFLCCLYSSKFTKFGQLILRKIIIIAAIRCQILQLKCTKFNFNWAPLVRPRSR